MDKCFSKGDALNKWTDGCEHIGSRNPDTTVTTIGIGGNGTYTRQTPVSYTGRGLGTPTDDNEQIFGPGGTLGGPSYSDASISPTTGYAEGDTKLNTWAPDPSSPSTLRPVEESDFATGNTSTPAGLQGTSALAQPGAPALPPPPPTPPSTRPYIWKPS